MSWVGDLMKSGLVMTAGVLCVINLIALFHHLHQLTTSSSTEVLPTYQETMDTEDFRKFGKEMVDYICDYHQSIMTRRVTPEVQPGYLTQILPSRAPRKGEDWKQIIKDLETAIMPGIVHWNHPRFHAYFPAGNSYPSILGDMLADAIACVGFSWASSPACTELECVVLDWFGKMVGLPYTFLHESGVGGGVLQGSASECCLLAMLSARHQTLKALKAMHPFVEDGILLSKMIGYCSVLAHSCVEKAGLLALVKLRMLDVDEDHSLRGSQLARAVEEDRKLGLVPFFVCATLGTTACCSFDNVPEIGPICSKNNIWLHIDAAYAGSAFICPEFQPYFSGVEHANSVLINPNKWLLVNHDCSCFWVKDRDTLTSSLTVDPLYLQHRHADRATDFRHWGIPLSRRFRALKLWFVMRSYGVDKLQEYIRLHCRLAKSFGDLVRADTRFEIIGEVSLGLVCFRLKGPNTLTECLLKQVNDSGRLHMVPAAVDDTYFIRFAVCYEHATDDDIKEAWTIVVEYANDIVEKMEDGSIGEEADSVFSFDEDVVINKEKTNAILATKLRRKVLYKMISDPKSYSPRVLESLVYPRKDSVSDYGYVSGRGRDAGTPL